MLVLVEWDIFVLCLQIPGVSEVGKSGSTVVKAENGFMSAVMAFSVLVVAWPKEANGIVVENRVANTRA